MFDFTTENVLNDLSRISVINDATTLAAPASPAAAGSGTGGTLAAGTYYYKVTALNAQGETVGSTEVNATTTGTTSSVSISWTAVTGATGYRIYKGVATGVYTQYFADDASPFVDTGAAGTAGTIPTTNTAYVNNDPGVPSGDKALFIKKLNKYLASRAGKVYKRAGNSAVTEVNTVALPASGNTGGVYRLNVSVTMSGSYPIDYDRWAINKGKPFFVEVLVPTGTYTNAQLAAILVPKIQNGLKKYNGQNITDIVVTQSTGSIVVTASNEYQRLVSVIIELEDAAGENWTTIATGAVTTAGKEGFGTSWFITKNLRIPTQEATRFFGEDQDERPVIGTIYNQYTFEYTADRNFTGQGAVGQKITSKTTHVLFVPQSLAVTFEGFITSAFGAASILDAQSGFPVN